MLKNIRFGLERLAKHKYYSLLRKVVNYDHKKVYNIETKGQCYKTFYGHDLRIFVISLSDRHFQLSLTIAGKAGAYLSERYLSGAPL